MEEEYCGKVLDAVKVYERKIEEIKLLDEDVRLVEELMEGDSTPRASIWLDNEVNVDFAAKSMDDVKKVLKKFAEKGVMLEKFNESDTNPIWYLKGIKGKIRLCPTWQRGEDAEEGVTCRLVKVGEYTYSTPRYKLVCEEEV